MQQQQTTQTTQDAPAELIFKLWPWIEANQKTLIGGAAAVLILFGAYSFITSQHAAREAEAGTAFTQLLMQPRAGAEAADALNKLAEKYSGTQAAQRAQLQAAATLFSLGRYPDAQAAFQKSAETANGGPLAATANLGIAACMEAQGKNDLAIGAYQKVATTYSTTPSALPALVALGRLFEQAGKLKDAMANYENAARAGQAGGSLAQQAMIQAAVIKQKLATQESAAPAVKPAVVPAVKPAVAPAK
jgi:predicted negative regulator of RcsB-dependent stress response